MKKHSIINIIKNISKNDSSYYSRDDYVLIDTSIDTLNLGDCIIMNHCEDVLNNLITMDTSLRVSSHSYSPNMEVLQNKTKILCGTNILYNRMENQQQWALPKNIANYNNTILFGVGMNDIYLDKKPSLYTKLLYKVLLSKDAIHSVRDSITEKKLKEAGIQNVVNTSCPTMWDLTEDFIKEIPSTKSEYVVTTITDYNFNEEIDKQMLNILKKEYKKVFIWPSGSHDIDWCLSKIVNLDEFEILDSSLDAYHQLLTNNNIDYVGTRLHAGIEALNHKKRSVIIAVDNRARIIHNDTNLFIIERNDIPSMLSQIINSEISFDIHLPINEINIWKKQFIK